MKRTSALMGLAFLYGSSALAAEGDPVALAHKAGFTSCDTAIEATFDGMSRAASKRIEIQFDEDELRNHAVAFTASYGNVGDSVVQHVTIINNGEQCFTSSVVGAGKIICPKAGCERQIILSKKPRGQIFMSHQKEDLPLSALTTLIDPW